MKKILLRSASVLLLMIIVCIGSLFVCRHMRHFAPYYINEMAAENIRDQGSDGICWAISSCESIEIGMKYSASAYLSAQALVDFYHEKDENSGGSINDAMAYYAGWFGPVEENGKDVVCHIQDMTILTDCSQTDIKKAVLTYGSLVTSICFAGNEETHFSKYNPETGAYNLTAEAQDDHQLLIIGWDDNYSRDNFLNPPKQDGAYICMNSYGKEMGKGGLIYVSYESIGFGKECITYASGIESVNNYGHIYQTDITGWRTTRGFDSSSCWFANVYTMEESSKALAAGIYTTEKDTRCAIYVVSDFTGPDSFADMTLVGMDKIKEKGYHTICFDNPVSYQMGEQFAIIVYLSNEQGYVYACMDDTEQDASQGMRDNAIAYLSDCGESWREADDIYLCLKLFSE